MQEKLYSIEELTTILNLHEKTILRFIHEGKIKARKIGRSWKVTQEDLKTYVHGDAGTSVVAPARVDYGTLSERISVSAVVEIADQGDEEASRVSNSLLAMLNCKDPAWGKARFDFIRHPGDGTSKYVLYGTPRFISAVLSAFDMLCRQGEE